MGIYRTRKWTADIRYTATRLHALERYGRIVDGFILPHPHVLNLSSCGQTRAPDASCSDTLLVSTWQTPCSTCIVLRTFSVSCGKTRAPHVSCYDSLSVSIWRNSHAPHTCIMGRHCTRLNVGKPMLQTHGQRRVMYEQVKTSLHKISTKPWS